MTSLVALSTKDAVVLGCDSLATSTRRLLDPFELMEFFDEDDEYKLRLNEEGQPLLKEFGEVFNLTMDIPYDHMTDVDKLVDLSPLPMGFMYTGITSIGNRTIKSLLEEFRAEDKAFLTSPAPPNFTVKSVSSKLLAHLGKYYDQEYGKWDERVQPALEYLIAGYDKGRNEPLPKIRRGWLDPRGPNRPRGDEPAYSPGVAFAGMMQEIQRIVFGVDDQGRDNLEFRYLLLLKEFANRVQALNGPEAKLPDIAEFIKAGFHLFGKERPTDQGSPNFRLPGLVASWGDFSEQNAIDCVAWFIGIMREAHRFSSKMPTVGGPIHVALVTRESGFQYISREEYRHEDHRVQRIRPRARP